MANLKTDSPLSSRIVRSFLHFLNSVEPSDGADTEALEVAKDCLANVFKIDLSSIGTSDSLIDIFSSREETRSSLGNDGVPEAPTSSHGKNAAVSEAPQSSNQDQDRTSEPHSLGNDELFGKFFDVLEKIHYFRRMPDGNDDQIQLDRATHLFHSAVQEMKTAGCQSFDQKGLAEAFKAQGNKAMQSKRYIDAIELYTLAVALCENNAVYYCNRAAAFTQVRRYNEAVQDCLKSMEIDPNYSKAYSRLGFAYYAQGRYREAIDKGFQKALQLDPNNDSVKDNIRVAEQKLKEAQRRAGPGQSSTSTSHGQPSTQSGGGPRSSSIPRPPPPPFPMHPPFSMHPPPFPMHPPPFSMPHPPPFSASYSMDGYPTDFSSMMRNMTGNMFPPHFQDGHEGESGANPENEPGVRVDGNVNANFSVGEMPEELSDAFRSMMGMFSAPAPNGNQEDQNNNGRPGPS